MAGVGDCSGKASMGQAWTAPARTVSLEPSSCGFFLCFVLIHQLISLRADLLVHEKDGVELVFDVAAFGVDHCVKDQIKR